MWKNGMRIAEIFLRDHQVRKAIINNVSDTVTEVVVAYDKVMDDVAWQIAKRRFEAEQRTNQNK
jgi:hypothetical protein